MDIRDTYRKHHGLSLIELMVAMAIVSILLLGVTTVYVASKRAYQLNDEYAEIQENARFLFKNVTSDMRMAGYTGCRSIHDLSLDNASIRTTVAPEGFFRTIAGRPDPAPFGRDNFVIGHSPALINWLDTGIIQPPNLAPNTDAITFLHASSCSDALTANVAPGNDISISIANACNFQPGDLVIVTDCETSEVLTVTGTAPGQLQFNPGKNTPPAGIGQAFSRGSLVFRIERSTFYIGNYPVPQPPLPPTVGTGLFHLRYTNDGLGNYRLSPALVPAPTNPVIENVEDIVILFGIDSTGNGNIDAFLTADQVDVALIENTDPPPELPYKQTPWSRVVSVNIRFLTATEGVGDTNDRHPYTFNGVRVNNPGDNRIRKEFITAINLRNNTALKGTKW